MLKQKLNGSISIALKLVIIAIVLYVAIDILVQFLPPHYNPISQAESDLGVGPYGWLMNINFLIRGALSLAFVYALYRSWPSEKRPKAGLALIAAWGIGSFILAFSPTDVSGPATLHGTIHLVTAFLAFLFVSIGAILVSASIPIKSSWKKIRKYAVGLAIFILVALLVLGVGSAMHKIETSYFGLLERIFLGSVLLWMLAISIMLLDAKLVYSKTK